jgi:hypothetical protein
MLMTGSASPAASRGAARLRAVVALACVAGAAASASDTARAHHSISAVYDGARRSTVQGVVKEFQFVNPHPALIIDAGEAGAPEVWRLEMDNRWELVDIGISADTFKLGDRVVASGSASRTNAHGLYLLRLDRPADGLLYEQIGFSPRISTTR